MVNYLKDVFNMLAIVSTVCNGNILQHLQAEQNMLNLAFVFNHINYARYNSFQHLFQRKWWKSNPQAFKDLLLYGFGALSTGDPFSTTHRDLLTEHFNRECKGTAGPFQSEYISIYNFVLKWIVTSHTHSKLRQIKWEKLHHQNITRARLKVVPTSFLLVCFLSLKESTCETRKNIFYFTSKALFVLEKIKF